MRITVNGQPRDVKDGLTLSALLSELGVDNGTVVVERRREIFSAEEFGRVTVSPGDELEIVRFMGGG